MLISILLALLVVLASLGAGWITLALLGARHRTWLAGPVGFAALTVIAGLCIRLPGRAATAAVVIVLALVAGLLLVRIAARRPVASTDEPAGAPAAGVAVIAIALVAAAIPFVLEGRAGVLGEGIYTNDHAAQLYWTDWLKEGFGPEPSAVAWGYPVGPQSLVAVIAKGTGASLIDAFNGLLMAIPALTALAALAVLGALRPLPRIAVAVLAGLPFLGASFLAQSAFKETTMALLVIAFAATLALASEHEVVGAPRLGRTPAAGAGVLLALAALFAYSVPGLVWFALTLLGWLVVLAAVGDRRVDWAAARATIRRRRVLLAVVLLAVIGVAALTVGRISDFADRIGEVQASAGRLSSPVWPGEALGIWPEGDFRVVRGEVSGSLVATAIGVIVTLAGAAVIWRRRAYALLAALGAAAVIYIGARLFASIYVEAKALAIMAPLVIVVGIGGLLAAGAGKWGRALRALGIAALVAGAASTFLALREAPVGFSDRGSELETLAEQIEGERVAFLGVDRFAAYWLRGTLIESPGGYVPPEVRARPQKVWQQGLAMDFDTLASGRLDRFDYAITTTAPFQSTPPANWSEVDRTDSYVLWRREGETPRTAVFERSGRPGARLGSGACRRAGEAVVLPEPVVGKRSGWSLPNPFAAPATSTQTLELEPGNWLLSLQYHSQVDLSVRVADLEAELPASLVGMYLTHQGQSAFWPVGEVDVERGGSLDVSVSAEEPGGLERAIGAERRVWLGEVAAMRVDPLAGDPDEVPLSDACGAYVDHVGPSGGSTNVG